MPSRISAHDSKNFRKKVKPQHRVKNFTEEARRHRNEEAARRARLKPPKMVRTVDGKVWRMRKKGKYNSQGRFEDGIYLDSKAEADRYLQLKEMQQRGDIDQLEVHPTFQITVAGHPICKYEADFRYRIKPGRLGQRTLVEDVKGMETAEYKLKRKLVHALGLCDIVELKVTGNIQRYRYLTADQFHTAKDQPDAADDQHPVVGRADA